MLILTKDFVLPEPTFYGYKLHAVCSISGGIFQSFDISHICSRHPLLARYKTQMSDCVLLGDKAYLSQTIQLDLFNEVKYRIRNS